MAGRPHILLVDLPQEAHDRLAERGHTVQRGTLGPKFEVEPDPGLLPASLEHAHLPNRTEQDIIIVDFAGELRTAQPPVTWPPQGQQAFYQSKVRGIVDFRPRVVAALRRRAAGPHRTSYQQTPAWWTPGVYFRS